VQGDFGCQPVRHGLHAPQRRSLLFSQYSQGKLRNEPQRAFAADAPTGFIVCDQAQVMDCAFPANTPLMLARYAAIAAGETFVIYS